MIMTRLQNFTHGRKARLLSLGKLLVRSAPRQPLLDGACEKFFLMLEADDICMVDVTDVVDGDPLLQLTTKAMSITVKLMAKPLPKC